MREGVCTVCSQRTGNSLEKVSEGGPIVAVSIGSKLRLRDGATCYGIEKAQVVTVNRAPFDVNGYVCVTFKERPGTFLLSDFREVGKNDPGLAVFGETPDASISPELREALDDLLASFAPITEALERECARIDAIIDKAHRVIRRHEKTGRRRTAPPVRRRFR